MLLWGDLVVLVDGDCGLLVGFYVVYAHFCG